MPLTTDFNQAPFFDDYDENKKFYRILFRPSVAVQARELTQSQTILQNQISRFGDHVFKDGSVVKGCNPTVIKNLDFVRVDDAFFANANAFITSLTTDNLLVGQTSNVRAVPVVAKEGLVVNYPNTNRFYVKYLNTGANNATTFADGETIYVYNSNQAKLGTIDVNNQINSINVISTNSTVLAVGKGYGLRIEDGIIYHKGFFQLVDDQTIVVRDYDQYAGNTVVGFDTTEEIITENVDESLLDNALGYSNENAPGAYRLKLVPGLVAKNRIDIETSNAFFIVYEFSNISNDLIISRNKDSYNELADVFATRTYEESGDYVSKPFLVEPIEGETSSTFAYQVSPGTGFVHGYRVNLQSADKIETDRAITTANAVDQFITANYGYYCYVKEYAGAPDFSSLIEVDIYDTAQQRVTNRYSTAVTGTKIGTAKVKAVILDTGNPGFADTTYRIYLSDVNISSASKSFADNAKSLYLASGTYGSFWADFVLENSRARIYQGSEPGMVFPFGKKALKSLVVGATAFNYRALQQKSMSIDGIISVTTSDVPEATGGNDRLPFDLGIAGDPLEDQFIVTMASDGFTANLTGTVNAYSSNNVLRMIGNTANALFAPTEYISFYPTTGSTVVRQVISANSMYLTLDSAPWTNGFSNAACSFRKTYPTGYSIPLVDQYIGTREVNITSSTNFVVNTGIAYVANLVSTANVTVQYRMKRSSATPAKKEINKNRFVKINLNTNAGGFNGPWNLGLPDVVKINKVYAGNAAYTTASTADVTNYFNFDSGQKDDYYDHGKLVIKSQFKNTLTSTPYITVDLDHFSANLTAGRGFFSVDSYPTTNSTPDANTIAWAEIPQYKSARKTYDLRDCVDFRAVKNATANSSTTATGASINPATTNTFLSGTATYAAEPETNFESDISFYLGRHDLVTINSSGGLGVVKGTPSERPIVPISAVDAMTLCTTYVAPWPSITTRENEVYKRQDYGIKTEISSNRGYTMRDIGTIDDRLKRIEYYVTLNALEQQAQNFQATDADGNNRFKNGIYADAMVSHAFGEVSDDEYLWSIDQTYGHGRPTFYTESIDLKLDTANSVAGGTQVNGKFVTRPITNHELFIFQPYATKFRNNNQDIWSWNGVVNLYPSYDMKTDTTQQPAHDVSIDLTQPFMEFGNAANIFGTKYGAWRNLGRHGNLVTFDRTVTNTWAVPVSNTVPLGNFVTDVSFMPYMKETTIGFVATNMKPNSRIYAYFDREPVSNNCAPAILNTAFGGDLNTIFANVTTTGLLHNVVTKNGNFGDPLISSNTGTLTGLFVVPNGKFRTGDRQFMLLDVDSLTFGEDAALTKAYSTYTSSQISVTKQEVTITTTVPELHTSSYQQYYQVYDPIAQSFMVNAPQQQSGVYVTKIDVFFKSKDPNDGIRVVVCGMNNGLPDSTNKFGVARVESANVNVSDTANVATTFTFTNPIFLSSDREYAFYVEPETSSPEYRMWVSEMGNKDVTTGAQVSQNPYTGEMFRSSNARTWTPLPKEDIKFNLYVANFELGSGDAYFQNENDEYIKYNAITLANSNVSLQVGDQVWKVDSSNAVIVTAANSYGILQVLDEANKKMKLDSSSGNFATGNKLGFFRIAQAGNTTLANSSTLIGVANVVSLLNPPIHAIVPRLGVATPLGSTIDVNFHGVSNTGVVESGWFDLTFEEEREMLDQERIVYSRSNEIATLGADKSLTLKVTLNCTNKYISPAIDLARKDVIAVENIINNDNTKEYTRFGNAAAKYVSKPIVLADGQDAEDMKLFLSAYRPFNTDIEVYIKFLAADDPDPLNDKVWTKLDNLTPTLWSSPIDRFDFKEYEFKIPSSPNWSVFNVNANTAGANSTNESIALSQASSYLSVGDKLLYTIPAGNSAIGGLVSNTNYFVAFANTSAFTVANTPGGANINITEVRTTSPSEVHQFTGPIINRAYTNTDNYGVIEYFDATGSYHTTYKTFAIKIVLLSENGIYVPKINDVRGIALQV